MTGTSRPAPSCPITGLPAVRRIQMVSSSVLSLTWRLAFGVRGEPTVHERGDAVPDCGVALRLGVF